ncbi:hypothetical protein DPPLL_14410 [Desulfofustis limnaeus]|uniref:Uncharacterized protein n=1 Tax=Desulfofustis limnaeus TaxID=2740163 RepID=A0ABM7W7Z8_9BACT|nr:hypothetical protein DPPLL_14410 [Desulfofustis limnaeus]
MHAAGTWRKLPESSQQSVARPENRPSREVDSGMQKQAAHAHQTPARRNRSGICRLVALKCCLASDR